MSTVLVGGPTVATAVFDATAYARRAQQGRVFSGPTGFGGTLTSTRTEVASVEKGARTYVLEFREGSANVYAQHAFARLSAEFFSRGSVPPSV